MTDATLTLLILAGVVVLFVVNRIPVEMVAVGSALLLYGTGVITLPQAVAGFGDPAVLLIAALPVATPANMMVMGPAGYRFGDYWRLGLPLVGLFGLVAILLVPVIWRF